MTKKLDTPLKWPMVATQNIQDRVESTITTASVTFVPTGLSININTGKSKMMIHFTATTDNNTKDRHCYFELRIDDVQVALCETQSKQVNDPVQAAISFLTDCSRGNHTIDVRWRVDEGTGRIKGNENGQLIVQELKC